MARPREFDRDEALKAAVDAFWAHGFEATSTDDLLAAMKISRQSMYNAFGDKRRLYIEALQAYVDGSIADMLQRFSAAPSPLAGLEEVLLAWATPPPSRRALGCMGVNAHCEFGQSDPDVAAVLERAGRMQALGLKRLLRAAKADGEVDEALDEDTAVGFVNTTLAGMKVRARSGASARSLRATAVFAVDCLRAKK